MSRNIDENVVKVSLDNREFKKNANETIGLLDRVKRTASQKSSNNFLDGLEGSSRNAAKGLMGVDSAANTTSKKFNALKIAGTGALMSIGAKAVSVGSQVVKSLTLDPVLEGFREYEMQLNSVQTILANTKSKGSTIKDVNNALDELNKYADQTIYNFGQMTKNIGTFTAAGVDLQTSVDAIKGISNLAAMSGSSAEQASSAMYQLSQALAAGRVSLMDWNSVVNAGMGGEQFQNALKRTATQMGTNVDALIKKYGSFRESLTQGEWLTTKVLTETLKQISGAYTEAELIEQGYSEKQAKEIIDMANTATEAATKVKTFTQMMSVLKESVQSGWAASFRIIFGDYEQAKEIFTGLTNSITPFIEKMSDARNAILQSGLQDTSGWERFSNELKGAGVNLTDFQNKVSEVAKSHGVDVDELIKKHGSFADSLEAGWMKTNYISEALTKMGHTMKATAKEQEEYNNKLEDFKKKTREIASDDSLSLEQKMEKLSKAGLNAKTAMEIYNKELHGQKVTLGDLSKEQLKSIGYTDEQILKMRDLSREVTMTGSSLNKMAENATKANGRILLLKGLANILQPIIKVISSISTAFRSIFPPMTGTQLYNLISGFEQFTYKLRMSDTTVQQLTMTFKGLFAAVDMILKIVGGPARIAFEVLKGVLEGIGKAMGLTSTEFLSFTSKLGEALVNLNNAFDISGFVAKITSKLIPAISGAFDAILPSWHRVMRRLSDGATNIFNELIPNMGRGLNQLFNIIEEKLSAAYPKFKKFGRNIIEGLRNGLGEGFEEAVDKIIEIGKSICKGFANVLGIHSPSRVFFEFGKNIVQGLVNGIKSLVGLAADAIREIGDAIVDTFNEIDVSKVAGLTLVLPMAKVIGQIGNVFKSLSGFISSWSNPLKTKFKLSSFLGIDPVMKAFTSWGKGKEMEGRAKEMMAFAGAIGVLAGSMKLLSTIDSSGISRASEAMISIGVAAGIFLGGMRLIGGIGGAGGSISRFVLSIVGVVAAMKLLSGVTVGGAVKTLSSLVIVIGGFNAVMKLISLMPGDLKDVKKMMGITDKLMKIIFKFILLSGLSMLIPHSAIGKMAEICLFIGAMMTVTTYLSKFNTNSKALGRTLDSIKQMVKIISRLSHVLIAMTIFNAYPSAKNVTSVLLLLEGMTLIQAQLQLLAKITGVDNSRVKKIIKDIGLVLTELGIFAVALSLFKVNLSMDTVTAIVTLAGAATVIVGAVNIISKVQPVDSIKINEVLKSMGIVILGMSAFAVVLSMFKVNIPQETANSIATLALTVTGVAYAMVGLSMLPPINSAVVLPLLAQAGLVVGACAAFAGIVTGLNLKIDMGLMADIAITTTVITGIALLLGALGPALDGAAAGMLAAIPGIAIAIGVLAAIAGLMAGLGAIVSQLGEFRDMMNEAFDILADVMYGIGKIATSIIGGMLDGALSGLPAVAKYIKDFINAFQGVGGDVTTSIKNISQAILLLSGSGMLSAFSKMLGGESPLTKLGPELQKFGQGLKGFANSLAGVDLKALKDGAAAGKALGEMSNSFAGQGMSFMSFLRGNKDLDTIGEKLASFGHGMKSFGNTIAGVDVSQIKKAAAAGKALGEMQNAFDGQGWSLESFTFGEKDLSVIGPQLAGFGRGLASFSKSLDGVDPEKIKKAAEAGKSLGKMQNAFDGQGWSLESFTFGEKDMSVIGNQLPAIGKGMSKFAKSIDGVDASKVTKAAKALKEMAKMMKVIPETGGLTGIWEGETGIYQFTNSFEPLAKALKAFQKQVKGIPAKFDYTKFTDALTGMANFTKSLNAEDFSVENVEAFSKTANMLADDVAPALSKFGKAFRGKKGGKAVTIEEVNAVSKAIQPIVKILDTINSITVDKKSKKKNNLENIAEDFNSAVEELSKLRLAGLQKIYRNGPGHISPDGLSKVISSLVSVVDVVGKVDSATTDKKGKSNNLKDRVDEFNDAVVHLGRMKLSGLRFLGNDLNTKADPNGLTRFQNVGNVIKQVAEITNTVSAAVSDNSIFGKIKGGTVDLSAKIKEFKAAVNVLSGINFDTVLDKMLDGKNENRKNVDPSMFNGIKGSVTAINEIMKSIMEVVGKVPTDGGVKKSQIKLKMQAFKDAVGVLDDINLDTILDRMLDGKNDKRKPVNMEHFKNIKDSMTAVTEILGSISASVGTVDNSVGGSERAKIKLQVQAFKDSVEILDDINLDTILDRMLDGKNDKRQNLNVGQFDQLKQAVTAVNEMITTIQESMSSVKAGDGVAQGETIRQQMSTFKSAVDIISEINLNDVMMKLSGGQAGNVDFSPISQISEAIKQLNTALDEIQGTVQVKKKGPKLSEVIEVFKTSITSLSELNLTEIMNSMTGGAEINTDSVTKITQSIKSLATMMDEVQNSLKTKKGEKSIGDSIETFKSSLNSLKGLNLSEAISSITGKGIDVGLVQNATATIGEITKILSSISGNKYKVSNVTNYVSSANELAKIQVGAIASALNAGGKKIRASGFDISKQLGAGIRSGMNYVKSSTSHLTSGMIVELSKSVKQSQNEGRKVGDAYNKGIQSKRNTVHNAGMTLAKAANSGVASIGLRSKMYSHGRNASIGLADGIRSGLGSAASAANELARIASKAAKSKLEINSPSKVFRRYGLSIGEGLTQGMNRSEKSVSLASSRMASSSIEMVRTMVNDISNDIDKGFDTNVAPIITPVVDLNNIQNASNLVNDILSTDTSINASLAIKQQDGIINALNSRTSTKDIISEMRKLGKNIVDNSGNSTVINGITYDDGSNITSMVGELVRTAKIDGRS